MVKHRLVEMLLLLLLLPILRHHSCWFPWHALHLGLVLSPVISPVLSFSFPFSISFPCSLSLFFVLSFSQAQLAAYGRAPTGRLDLRPERDALRIVAAEIAKEAHLLVTTRPCARRMHICVKRRAFCGCWRPSDSVLLVLSVLLVFAVVCLGL